MASNKPIIKVTFAGATSVVLRDTNVRPQTAAVDSDGNLWTVDMVSGGTHYGLYSISGAGGGSDVRTEYSLFEDLTVAEGSAVYVNNMKIVDDNLYFVYSDSTYNANYQIIKFTDITGDADRSVIDTGIAIATYKIHDILVVSDTEIYFTLSDGAIGTSRYVKKFAYASGAWTLTTVVDSHEYVQVYHYEAYGDIRPLQKNNYDLYILGGVIDGTSGIMRVYDSSWNQLESIDVSDATNNVGFGVYIGDENDENTYTVCGYTGDNVYKIYPRTFVLGDTEPTMSNTIVHITSNYTDLGMPNEKRVSRAYLDIDCKYPGCGAFYIEPDYKINYATHAFGESAEPSGAVSMRPFQHYGHQDWVYTNSSFDDDAEQWQPTRIDVGTKGTAFRYTIRAGDVSTNVTGTMRIRPPKVMVQVKELP